MSLRKQASQPRAGGFSPPDSTPWVGLLYEVILGDQFAIRHKPVDEFDRRMFLLFLRDIHLVDRPSTSDLSTVLSAVSDYSLLSAAARASCGRTDVSRRAQEACYDQPADRTRRCHSDSRDVVAAYGGCRAHR